MPGRAQHGLAVARHLDEGLRGLGDVLVDVRGDSWRERLAIERDTKRKSGGGGGKRAAESIEKRKSKDVGGRGVGLKQSKPSAGSTDKRTGRALGSQSKTVVGITKEIGTRGKREHG